MEYDLFISYSHADTRFARRLQRVLHRLAKPWYRLRAMRTFRDTTSLSANPNLWDSIRAALDRSSWFLLLASPEASRSPWVAKELDYWLAGKGPDRLLLAIARGQLAWDDEAGDFDWARTDCLPSVLKGRFAAEPLHVDFRAEAAEGAPVETAELQLKASTIAGAVLDELPMDIVGEDIAQRRKALRLAIAAAVSLAVLLIVAVGSGTVATRRGWEIQTQNTKISRNLSRNYRDRALFDFESGNFQQGLSRLWKAYDTAPEGGTLRGDLLRLLALWDASTPRVCIVPSGGSDPPSTVHELAWSDDGSRLLTSHVAIWGGRPAPAVRIWEAATGRPVGMPIVHEAAVSALAMDRAGRLLTGSDDGVARLWGPGGELLDEWPVLRDANPLRTITAVAFGAGEDEVITADSTGSLQSWRRGQDTPSGPPLAHPDLMRINDIALRADSEQAVVGYENGEVRVWGLGASRGTMHRLARDPESDPGGAIVAVAFSPDQAQILAADRTGRIDFWDAMTFKPSGEATVPVQEIQDAAFGRPEAVIYGDGTVWSARNRPTGRGLSFPDHELFLRGRRGAALSPDGVRVAMRAKSDPIVPMRTAEYESQPGTAWSWSVDPGRPLSDPLQDGDDIVAVRFQGTGRLLTVLDDRWDARPTSGGGPEGEPLVIEGSILACNEDGSAVAVADFDGRVRVRSTKDAEAIGRSIEGQDENSPAAFRPRHADELWILGQDGRVGLWDLGRGEPRRQGWLAETIGSEGMRFSPDGSLLATWTNDRRIILRDLEGGTGRVLWRTDPHPAAIEALEFSPSGALIATADANGRILLWDTMDRAQHGESMSTDGAKVTCMEFSPGDEFLAVGEQDGSDRLGKVQLWQVATQVHAGAPILLETKQVSSLRFSPDSKHLAVGSEGRGNTGVRIYAMPPRYAEGAADFGPRLRAWIEARTGLHWMADAAGTDRMEPLLYVDWMDRWRRLEPLGGLPVDGS